MLWFASEGSMWFGWTKYIDPSPSAQDDTLKIAVVRRSTIDCN